MPLSSPAPPPGPSPCCSLECWFQAPRGWATASGWRWGTPLGLGGLRSRPAPRFPQASLLSQAHESSAPSSGVIWVASRAWSPALRQGPPSSVPAAGSAFCQAAQLHLQLQSKHDAATCFVDAGNAFKKADPQGEGLCGPRAPAEPLQRRPQVSSAPRRAALAL